MENECRDKDCPLYVQGGFHEKGAAGMCKYESIPDEDFLSDCCGAEFDPFGFSRNDGLWDEKCLKCGKPCDPVWREKPKQ